MTETLNYTRLGATDRRSANDQWHNIPYSNLETRSFPHAPPSKTQGFALGGYVSGLQPSILQFDHSAKGATHTRPGLQPSDLLFDHSANGA